MTHDIPPSAEIISFKDFQPLANTHSLRQAFFGIEIMVAVDLTLAQLMHELDEHGFVLDEDHDPWVPEGITVVLCIDQHVLLFDIGDPRSRYYEHTPIEIPDSVLALFNQQAPE
jgi:hypothetical protein